MVSPFTSLEIPPLDDPVHDAPVEVKHQFVWTFYVGDSCGSACETTVEPLPGAS